MIYLLEVASKITEISDLITSKWAEILGWISIPSIVTALIVCSFKLITAKMSQKIAKKNIQPLINEVQNAKEIFNNTCEQLKNEFDSKLIEYENAVKQGIVNGFTTYEEKKNEICAEILNADEAVKEMVGEIETKTIDILENYEIGINDAIEEPAEIVEQKIEEPIVENAEINVEEEIDPFAR